MERKPRGAGAYARRGRVPSARRAYARVISAAAIIVVLLGLAWRGECWAYIDPNAGGFLSQILVPLASILLSFLFYCRKEIRKLAKSARNRWRKIDSRDTSDEAGK
jgi:hypothetical protein